MNEKRFQDMNGRKVYSFCFQTHDETNYMTPRENVMYELLFEYMGTHAETWILRIENGVETDRYNIRFVIYITWEPENEDAK